MSRSRQGIAWVGANLVPLVLIPLAGPARLGRGLAGLAAAARAARGASARTVTTVDANASTRPTHKVTTVVKTTPRRLAVAPLRGARAGAALPRRRRRGDRRLPRPDRQPRARQGRREDRPDRRPSSPARRRSSGASPGAAPRPRRTRAGSTATCGRWRRGDGRARRAGAPRLGADDGGRRSRTGSRTISSSARVYPRGVIVAHLDLDAFFAAVEELESPELRRQAARRRRRPARPRRRRDRELRRAAVRDRLGDVVRRGAPPLPAGRLRPAARRRSTASTRARSGRSCARSCRRSSRPGSTRATSTSARSRPPSTTPARSPRRCGQS